jgi:hypothetical protein
MRYPIRLSLLCLALSLALWGAVPVVAGSSQTTEDYMVEVQLATLQVEKAHRDLERAQKQLEMATVMHSEGLVRSDAVVQAEQAVDDATFRCVEAELRAQQAQARAVAAEAQTRKVSLDVAGAPLPDALKLMFEGTEQSFVLSREAAGTRVTLTLKNVPLNQAVRALCDLYGLTYRVDGNLWTILPGGATMLTFEGRRVPVYGALSLPQGLPADWSSAFGSDPQTVVSRILSTGSTSGLAVSRDPHKLTHFPGASKLIDLDVQDVPLPQVADQLAKAAGPDADGALAIMVVDSVPKDLKVTARIYKMQVADVLFMLVDQANLSYVMDPPVHQVPAASADKVYRIYIVPRSELSISGAGLGGGGDG